MDSMPPQLAAGMPWQVQQLDQAQQNYAVPGHAIQQDICAPGHLLMGNDTRSAYEAVKEESADDTIAALLTAPAFHSSLMHGVSDAALSLALEKPALSLALEKPALSINTSPGLLASKLDDRGSYPPSAVISCDLPADATQTAHMSDECKESPDSCLDAANKKRHRLRPEQTRRLMEVFEKTTKPDSEMRKVLGRELSMTPRTVQIWFQNRRAKLKRESLAAGTLRPQGRFPERPPDGRSRLTFNQPYLNRRQPVRVASEGYEQLRHAGGFASYVPDGLCGLPLQNPAQVSVPMDMSLHLPGGQMSSCLAPQALGQSAMGVPAGQPLGAPRDSLPSDHAVHGVFPIGPHGYPVLAEHAHMYSAEQLGISHGPAVPLQGGVPATAAHLYDHRAGHGDRGGRYRSFTTDSHSLMHLGQLAPGLDSGLTVGGGDPAFAQNDFAVGSEHALLHTGNHHYAQNPAGGMHMGSQPLSASDLPTADALLESRRRHLQDLMIINQTHAARDRQAKAAAASAGAGPDRPLLFSDLAQQRLSSDDDGLAVHVAAINASSIAAAQGATALTGIPVPVSYQSAGLSVPQTALRSQSAMLGAQYSTATTTSGSEAGADHGSAVGQCASGAAMSQYQILHDILMQYNGMEFLDAGGDPNQAPRALDQPLFMPEATADSMLPAALADLSANFGAASGSLFGDELGPPVSAGIATVASLGIDGHFCGDLAGGLSGSDSPSVSTGNASSSTSAAPTQTVTPTTSRLSPAPKTESQNVVSVASDGPVGQREVMIEQLSFSTMPF